VYATKQLMKGKLDKQACEYKNYWQNGLVPTAINIEVEVQVARWVGNPRLGIIYLSQHSLIREILHEYK
jgi:hypothetical protein